MKVKTALTVLLCIGATKWYRMQVLGLFGSQERVLLVLFFFFTEGVPSAGAVYQEESRFKVN